jgi:hypothetical protein
MTDYYLKITTSNKINDRQHRELEALDNISQYRKYQTEYKIHCWVPPITILPPQDTSIEGLIWD